MPPIVTSENKKRDHAVGIFTTAYDSLGLTEEQAHRVNMCGDQLKRVVAAELRRLAAEGRIVSIADQVELLIERGYHTTCNMTAEAYRKVWPKEVEQPAEYVSRLDIPFLVDDTLTLERKVACNANLYLGVQPDACTTAIAHPVHPETGVRLTRWVEFIQLSRYLNQRVEDVDALLPADEVGLTPTEGVHLLGQCEKHLRKYAVDLCGSRCGSRGAPFVYWFGNDQAGLDASDVGVRDPFCGSGSRGRRVIPVTWKT